MSQVGVLTLQAGTLIGLPYLAWRYLGFRYFAPLAIVQIICGLCLGPSVLGHISPSVQQELFGQTSLVSISGVATVGVVLFSLISGMQTEVKVFRSAGRADLGIALSSFLIPVLFGAGFGYWLSATNPSAVGQNATPWIFAAAFGVCIAVTALPVLAALLKEMEIVDSELGQQALGFAAMTDGAVWISVSILLIVCAGARGDSAWHIGLIPFYLLAVAVVLPRLMHGAVRMLDKNGEASDTILMLACISAFCSAFLSEFTGLGYVIGAYLAGLAMPGSVRTGLVRRLDWPVTFLLMPFFFMVTGLRVETDLFSFGVLAVSVAGTVLAMAGKILGVTVPAIAFGRNARRSLALGVLLQSKGLVEVLVVTVLIDAGIFTRGIFSALILVAIFCTIFAMPLTGLILGRNDVRDVTLGHRSLGHAKLAR